MSVEHLERISCDNPDCTVYVDELVRMFPGRYELGEHMRPQLGAKGWTNVGELDFCPSHQPLAFMSLSDDKHR